MAHDGIIDAEAAMMLEYGSAAYRIDGPPDRVLFAARETSSCGRVAYIDNGAMPQIAGGRRA